VSLFICAALALTAAQEAKPLPLVDATALAVSGDRLFVGTTTGDVAIYNAKTREPLSTMTSTRKGIVSLVASSPQGTAWIVGPRPAAIRDRLGESVKASDQTLIVHLPDDRTITVDLRPAGVESPVRALGWLGYRLVLMEDFGVAFFNARAGAIELSETFMPPALAKEVSQSRVWISDPWMLVARPTAMRRNPRSTGLPYVSLFTAYKLDNNRWTKRGGFASNALDVEPAGELSVAEDGKIPFGSQFKTVSETAGFDATGVAAIEGGNLLNAPIFNDSWETARHPLPDWLTGEGRPDALWLQVSGDDVWWWTGDVLLKQSRSSGAARAFLAWNDAQAIVNAFLADAGGLWIATNQGVRRLDLNDVDKNLGYGGFLSVPLGLETEHPADKTADKIVTELYKWRFATPDLAGKDGARMVSEVLKAVGVSLPPNQKDIVESPFGQPVHDELRVGDVISSTKGVCVYIGNGKTVEMKDGVVKNGDIWSKPYATIRRFTK